MSRKARPTRRRKGKSSKVRLASGARKKVTKRVPRRTSRSQRKVAKARKPVKRNRKSPKSDPRLEAAVLEMNRGQSLTAAARASGVPRRELQTHLARRRLASRKRGRWVTKDNRPRRVPVLTRGRIRVLTVPNYEEARLAGEYWHSAGEFVRTNDLAHIRPFRDKAVKAVNGRRHPLETDPNALHRIAAMDTPDFHEIYEITSNT